MIDLIRKEVSKTASAEENINRIREFLQVLMLKVMFDKGHLEPIAFTGGTALRILHGLKRYSEDMDFSLVNKKGYDFARMQADLINELNKNNIKTEGARLKLDSTVNSCFISFPELIPALAISGYPKKNLKIKIEVDSNPPEGGKTAIVPVTDRFVIAVKTFDLPSLFATKLHACLFRRYTKGRDFYDLVWYLGKRVVPNLTLLNNAIQQTEKKDMGLTTLNYKSLIIDKITGLDFKKVREDVAVFLEDKAELKLLDQELLLGMLKNI